MSGAHKAERLAGRFAVKEAVMKALGTGKTQGILWKDVETLRGRVESPRCTCTGRRCDGRSCGAAARCTCRSRMTAGRRWRFVILEKAGAE